MIHWSHPMHFIARPEQTALSSHWGMLGVSYHPHITTPPWLFSKTSDSFLEIYLPLSGPSTLPRISYSCLPLYCYIWFMYTTSWSIASSNHYLSILLFPLYQPPLSLDSRKASFRAIWHNTSLYPQIAIPFTCSLDLSLHEVIPWNTLHLFAG